MRTLVVIAALFSTSVLVAWAATEEQAAQNKRLEKLFAARDKRQVVVLPRGWYYHRFDHLTIDGTGQLTPEEATRRGYLRCPECLPPRSTAELAEQTSASKPTVSKYYKTYLEERANPTQVSLPKGATGGGSAGGSGPGLPSPGGGSSGSGSMPFVPPPIPGGRK